LSTAPRIILVTGAARGLGAATALALHDRGLTPVLGLRRAPGAACGFKPGSTRTGVYCRALGRLPLAMIRGLACEEGRQLHGRARREGSWRGRAVKLVDGTGDLDA
jgi:NAD(P)-dependent dehydrogenase (short-subunit alcohol dehydrogenase family)